MKVALKKPTESLACVSSGHLGVLLINETKLVCHICWCRASTSPSSSDCTPTRKKSVPLKVRVSYVMSYLC